MRLSAGSYISSADQIAAGIITAAKLASTLDISGKTVTLPATSVTAGMLTAALDLSGKTLTLPSGFTPGLTLKSTTTLGSGATNVTASSLDFDTDGYYFVVGTILNSSGGVEGYHMAFNGDTTDANYDTSEFEAATTSATVAREDNRDITQTNLVNTSCINFFGVLMRDVNGYAVAMIHYSGGTGTSTQTGITYHHKSNSAANITSFSIYSDVSGGCATGSTMSVFKLIKA